MLEIVWTRRAEDHLQRIFAELDDFSPQLAEAWLEDVGKRAALLGRFPNMAPVWRDRFRRLLLPRELSLFYTIEARGVILAGIFPLAMNPETILRRLEETDWP